MTTYELHQFDGLCPADRLRVRLEGFNSFAGDQVFPGARAPGSERAPARRSRWSQPRCCAEPLHRELDGPDHARARTATSWTPASPARTTFQVRPIRSRVERARPKLDRFLFRLPAPLSERGGAASDAPRPITRSRHARPSHIVRRPVQHPGQYAHAIRPERALGGDVDLISTTPMVCSRSSPAPDDPERLAPPGPLGVSTKPLEDVRGQGIELSRFSISSRSAPTHRRYRRGGHLHRCATSLPHKLRRRTQSNRYLTTASVRAPTPSASVRRRTTAPALSDPFGPAPRPPNPLASRPASAPHRRLEQ